MPVLEFCKRRLKEGITHSDPAVLKIFPEIRSATDVDFVFYSSIENPNDFFALGVWPSKAAWDEYVAWDEEPAFMTALREVSDFEWVEFAEFDSIKSLPIEAPVMTVTRAFLRGGEHPKEYYRKISDLKEPIEMETKPHPCVFSWTIDTVPEGQHKWLMFVGWNSKKHHQDYAAWLRRTPGFEEFPTIPEHYDEGTTHNHTFNMERSRDRYLANTSYIGGLSSFCALTGVDLSKYALDEPFNFDNEELASAGIQGIFNNFKMVEKDKPWTPRMVGEKVGFGGFGPMPVGTPEQVADIMEKWFVEADIDGFNLQYICNPESITDILELLVPELQRRGIYWTDYAVPGGTLRENIQGRPGQPFLGPDHTGAKLRGVIPTPYLAVGGLKES